MATYTETFSGQTTGSNSTTFTNRYTSETSISIENPAIGEQDDRVLRFTTGDSTGYYLQSMDAVDSDGNRDNCEIVTRVMQTVDDDRNWYVYGRASGSATSETCYYFTINSTGLLVIARINSGAGYTVLDSVNSEAWECPLVYMPDQSDWSYCPTNRWVNVRFRINGTGATVTLQAKVWLDHQEEPSGWLLEASDTDASRITSAGWVGVGRWNNTGTVYYDAVGVGTNGDTAPFPSSTANIRLTTSTAAALAKYDATPVRLTTAALETLAANDATPIRFTTCSVSVLMTLGTTSGATGPVVCTIIM